MLRLKSRRPIGRATRAIPTKQGPDRRRQTHDREYDDDGEHLRQHLWPASVKVEIAPLTMIQAFG
jgi:hypothetical protein